ncbi:hypothetical protein CVT24_006168 [Panaeolus cyanescens]|uniref:Cyclin N-terminal domain-containing protein n=1 Tax=Panaeolus cyanescens TaxID=181874 RepID=A0A409V8N1_9AGAR|nr:hypothetical protein CVT24_006168 [Panaeolus cyanescens]
MQTATQLLAQRAPATRTKPRWQPYNSLQSSTRSPITTCLSMHIKAQSPTPNPQSSLQNLPQIDSNQIPTPRDITVLKDANKQKYSIGLIDQAVKTLSEIWRPQDIPRVFLAPTKIGPAGLALSHSTPSLHNQSASPSVVQPLSAHSSAPQVLLATDDDSDSSLLPMRPFVHEVLKRSRTSGNILQAALCYLEAIRSKVPEILEQERKGFRAQFEPESRVIIATEEELQAEVSSIASTGSISSYGDDEDAVKTVRVSDCDYDDQGRSDSSIPISAHNPASPMFALPSPLLCPRRAFLASLILASKFFQDKCYSNKAWAKLSGLPPKEISRCERALGQVLEWRLWVGKKPVPVAPAAPAPPLPTIHRTMSRSHSAGMIAVSSTTQPFFTQVESAGSEVMPSSNVIPEMVSVRSANTLRRCSTLPVDIFTVPSSTGLAASSPVPTIVVEKNDDVVMHSISSLVSQSKLQQVPSPTSSTTPSPDTPTLTYSPTSTESSSLDSNLSQPEENRTFTSLDGTRAWVESQPHASLGLGLDVNNKESRKPFDLRRSVMIAVASADSPEYSTPSCLWHAENSRCFGDVHVARQ